MSTFDDLLATAVLPERVVRVCLRGDLTSALSDAEKDLEAAKKVPATSLSGSGIPPLQARVDELSAAVQDAAVAITVRGINARAWSDLVTANPPREDFPGDRSFGYNTDALFDELVKACIIDPVLTDAQFDTLYEHLSAGQWNVLTDAALSVTRRDVDVPFSRPASDSTGDSD